MFFPRYLFKLASDGSLRRPRERARQTSLDVALHPPTRYGRAGFVLGFLQTPICALIALGSEDSVRDHRREVHDRNVREMEEAPPAMNTEMERVARPKSVHLRHDAYY